ncbi:hypothetical protein PRZ48_008985 [Zasmidium cellare]|uniref:MYND-type domain-containing protein n=1 Tax=Zasmidium cellare TaxID=395010 RepID=A0ABR0EHX6_ZASCE|nr:hypothetical protein PRZ48_008985 [Zasmidium cellare]
MPHQACIPVLQVSLTAGHDSGVGIEFEDVTPCDLERTEFEAPGWTTSPISEVLGIPLKIKPYNGNAPTHPLHHCIVNTMLIDIDPASNNFGQPSAPSIFGPVYVARVDGEPLDRIFFLPFMIQVCGTIAGLAHKHNATEDVSIKQTLKLLAPGEASLAGFQKHWQAFTAMIEQVGTPDEKAFFHGVGCPVKVEDKVAVCAGCGVEGFGATVFNILIIVAMAESAPVFGVVIACTANTAGPDDQPTPYVRGVDVGGETHLQPTMISADTFNGDGWISSDLSTRLGMPLKIKQTTTPSLPPGYNVYSRILNALLANADVDSEDFGKYMAPPMFGAAVMVREDGQPLGREVEILLQLIGKFVCAFLQGYGTDFDDKHRKEMDRFVEPRIFGTQWRLHCMLNAAKATNQVEKNFWLSIEPPKPVYKKKEGCAKCETKASEETKLMICAACKTTEYCSRECQKEDWKDHKQYCKGMQMINKMPKSWTPSAA